MKRTYTLSNTDSLLVTDVQNDFLPGGALPVPQGDQIIPVLNQYSNLFYQAGAHVLASRDWHPVNHISFKSQGGLWPPHCVQDTKGASFHKSLKLPKGTKLISKATNANKEAYSAFDKTELESELNAKCVKRFFIGGLATDYCILNTVLDALKLGFETIVLKDAIKGINVNPDDVEKAIATMTKAGVKYAMFESFTLNK